MSLVFSKLWAPKECLKSQFPCSSFFPLFNFGILWSTASVIFVSVYLLKTLQHLLSCLLSLKWPVEENEATDVTKNIKHRKMKGTRVLRIVGNDWMALDGSQCWDVTWDKSYTNNHWLQCDFFIPVSILAKFSVWWPIFCSVKQKNETIITYLLSRLPWAGHL